MAKEPQGTVHAMEDEMRANKQGVFAAPSELRAKASPSIAFTHAAEAPAEQPAKAAPAAEAAKPAAPAKAAPATEAKPSAKAPRGIFGRRK